MILAQNKNIVLKNTIANLINVYSFVCLLYYCKCCDLSTINLLLSKTVS